MATDETAARVALARAHLHAQVDGWLSGAFEADVQDVQAVLAHVVAQAARLASLDGDVGSARNAALAFEGAYRDLEEAYHAQAARLAVVEGERDAVRAVLEAWTVDHPPTPQGYAGCATCDAIPAIVSTWKEE